MLRYGLLPVLIRLLYRPPGAFLPDRRRGRTGKSDFLALYVLADLHLSHSSDKPMDVFGARWENHTEKILNNWQSAVGSGDTTVIPGDLSWGMNFGNTAEDLRFVHELNGRKLIGKGNHDYWWQTMRKLNAFKEENGFSSIDFLFNNAFYEQGFIICGTRGWTVSEKPSAEDERILMRESGRLRISLECGKKLKESAPEDTETLVFMHYPPAVGETVYEPFAELFAEYGVKRCFYGHIHAAKAENLAARAGQTRLYCVSADMINFKPMRIDRV